jgi:hypothetical protein
MELTKENEPVLEIGARLKGQLKEKYQAIKQKRGVSADAELMRLLISEEYERITAKKGN